MTDGIVVFDLAGPFRVTASDGTNLTPRAAKAQALLVLLADARHGERTRLWLQDKLWSDRAPEQGSQSLRQSLKQIRKALGERCDILDADRQRVRLDLEKVALRRDGAGELAEGLDVRDPEFETWLATARMSESSPRAEISGSHGLRPATPRYDLTASTSSLRTRIAVRHLPSGDASLDWMAELAADGLATALLEQFEAEIVDADAPAFGLGGRVCGVQGFRPASDSFGLRVAVSDGLGRRFWNGHRIVPDGMGALETIDLLRLVNETVEAVGDSLLQRAEDDPQTADYLCRLAIRKMFMMRPEASAEADALLQAAEQRSPRGLYSAWRAQLKVIQWLERHESDEDALMSHAEELTAYALEREPSNAMVLATVANARGLMKDDMGEALELATRATNLNPANPMAWWAISAVRMYTGDMDRALAAASRGHDLAGLTPNSYWWDQQLGYAALLLDDLDRALVLMTRASVMAPNFRPPLRYLIGLHAARGDETRATEAVGRLQSLEPDFSLDRMVRDDGYPASLLKRAPGVDMARISALA